MDTPATTANTGIDSRGAINPTFIIGNLPVGSSEPSTIPYKLPKSGVRQFVGRDEALKKLDKQLQESERIAISTLTGMGGIGKTELALQYALADRDKVEEERNYQAGICWINVSEETSNIEEKTNVGIQILDFAKNYLQIQIPEENELKLKDRIQVCWQKWRKGDTLIIFDNVKYLEQIEDYLPPQSKKFKLIITTRNINLRNNFNLLELDLLDEESAIKLLGSFIGDKRIEQEREDAEKLCNWLGYLPLSIELAARYLEDTGEKIENYYQKLQQQKLKDKSLERPKDQLMTAKRGVIATFELSWQELSEDTKQLGCFLSLFEAQPIPWKFIETHLGEAAVKSTSKFKNIFSSIVQIFIRNKSQIELSQSQQQLRELTKLSLIKEKNEQVYEIHTLIHEYLRDKLNESKLVNSAKETYCQLMGAIAKEIPEQTVQSDIQKLTPIIPHLAVAARELSQWIKNDDLMWVYVGLKRFYEGQGLYKEAEPWGKQCLSVTQERFFGDDLDVARSLNNLAGLYKIQGRYNEAEPLYIQALEMYRRMFEGDHPDVATNLNDLAALYDDQGRYTEAEPLYIQAYEMYRRMFEGNHPQVATSLNNLAALYYHQGRYTEAEPLYTEAYEMTRRIFTGDHPSVATSLNNLALFYKSQGRYTEAEPLYTEALEMRRRIFTGDHPDVATSLNNLALLYKIQGKYTEAEPLYTEALEMIRRMFEGDHPDVATSLNNLALLYSSQDRYTEAEPLCTEALEMRRRMFEGDHPDVASSLNNLAVLYRIQGRYTKAEPLYTEALKMRRRIFTGDHPDVARNLNNLAELYRIQGRYTEAEPLYTEALEMRRRMFEGDHPDVTTSLNNLAELYCSQDRYTEAEPLYTEALEMTKRMFDGNHPSVAGSLNNLAVLYYNQGRYTEAEPLYNEALEMTKRMFDGDHPSVATSLNNLALLYKSQGRYTEAEPLYTEALEMRRRIFTGDHPDVALSLNNLAELYYSQDRYDEAKSLYTEALEMAERTLGTDHPTTQSIRQNYDDLQSII
uniref:NB-ARC domain protein n=1 Tax=Gloeothece verrucosa (strain PCC 7822) TaxID=497965 RepID=E0UCI1_GLOV7|nr:NB-ARC domain protein [Gloeothece verrucosa PCC 7822]